MMLAHHTAQSSPFEVSMTKAMLLTCRECGKAYESRKAGGYCSVPCYRSAQKAGKYIGTKGHKQGRIHQCFHCGKDVFGSFARDRSGNSCDNKFCSRECYDLSRTLERSKRSRVCDHCGEIYIPKSKAANYRFCSAGCRLLGLKNPPIHCKVCGAYFSAIHLSLATGKFISSKNRKTCSKECLKTFYRNDVSRKLKISAAFTGSKHPNWLGGRADQPHRNAWDRLADSIRERDGHKCSKCGKTESANRRRLDVHHIVPRRECLSPEIANHPDNLISLCDTCHLKVEWESGQKRGTRRRAKRCKKVA